MPAASPNKRAAETCPASAAALSLNDENPAAILQQDHQERNAALELDLTGVPAHLHARACTWFERQMRQLERAHGEHWPANREWLVDYLKAELREMVAKELGQHHAV